MRTTRVLTAVGLAALIAGPAFAQQSPPGLDWRRIRTERFNVIFPARITSDAQRVANTLEHIYGPVSKTLKGPEKPVDVVLMNQVAEANGFVAMAPRRTVWFSTPPQGTGLSGEWYQLLAVHEMRHVVQNDRLRRGFIRLAWLLSGEFGQSAMSHLLVPSWFWEGDAVGIETALSTTGRGRMPRFDLDIRALLLDGRRYSYYKALHRSYRDWYPSHYPLGYFLTTYVRRHHGAGTWDRVLGRTAWWGFHPFSFSRALRKHTGASAAGTYERAMDELTGLWQAQQEGLVTTPLRVLPGQSRSDIWTNYSYPHAAARRQCPGEQGRPRRPADPGEAPPRRPPGAPAPVQFPRRLSRRRRHRRLEPPHPGPALGLPQLLRHHGPGDRQRPRAPAHPQGPALRPGSLSRRRAPGRRRVRAGPALPPRAAGDRHGRRAGPVPGPRRGPLAQTGVVGGRPPYRRGAPGRGRQHPRAHRRRRRPGGDRAAPYPRRHRLAGLPGSLPALRLPPVGDRQHPRRPPGERGPLPGDLPPPGGDPCGRRRRLPPVPGVHRRRLPHRGHGPGPRGLDAGRAGRGPQGALLRAAHRPGARRSPVDGHPAAVLAGERLSAPGESAQSPQLVLQYPAAAPLPHPHFPRSPRSQQYERRRRVQQQRERLQCPGRPPPGGVVSGAQRRRPLGRARLGVRDRRREDQ